MRLVSQKSGLVVEEIHALKPEMLNGASLELRASMARWIGVSQLRAALFFSGFKKALFHRGSFYVVKRDGEIVGAAYLKLVKEMMCGIEAGQADWALLYGIGADDSLALEHIFTHTLDVSVKHGVKTLYLGEKLKVKRNRIELIHDVFKKYLAQRGYTWSDLNLSIMPSPAALSFQR